MFRLTLNILIIWGLYTLFTSPQFSQIAGTLKIVGKILVSPFV
jgi:hypothetical protein